MKKFLNLDKIKNLFNCRPCGIKYDGRPSIHAEEIALKNFIRNKSKKQLQKGFTICTMRMIKNQHTKINQIGNSKPCCKCLFHTIKKILANNNINPNKINIIYSDGVNLIKTNYINLCNQPKFLSSGSKLNHTL